MADPASLTLAILPVVVEVLKAYSLVNHKIKVFRSYSAEVQRVRRSVWQQKLLFQSYWEVLLSNIRHDGCNAASMVDDLSDPNWESQDLEQKIRVCLRNNSDCCIETMQVIGETLIGIEHRLKAFDVLSDAKVENEPLTQRTRRVKQRIGCAIKLTFEEKEYHRQIEILREQNTVLRQLYDDARKLEGHKAQSNRTTITKRAPKFNSVRDASEKLYDTLTEGNTSFLNGPTAVKLCLESKEVGSAICLDILICRRVPETGSSAEQVVPIFPIRQVTVEAMELRENVRSLVHRGVSSNQSMEVPISSQDSSSHGITNTLSRTRCATWPEAERLLLAPALGQLSLSTCENICEELMVRACKRDINGPRCPGLLETCTGTYKHVFHSSADCSMQACCSFLIPQPAHEISLYDALQKEVHHIIGMVDQLKLARSLILGVLRYYNTGWLSDQWDSRDLSLFSKDGELSGQAVRTLHYTKTMSASLPGLSTSEVQQVPSSPNATRPSRNAVRIPGVRNVIIYNLGLQLLRIAKWSQLNDMDPLKADDYIEQHRNHPPLGQKYHEFARKCVECDFGFGKRLESVELRRAIYSGVEELDEVIAGLENLGMR